MFAIDGVKLPSNDSKERSGTHDELRHHARRLGKAADKIVGLRQSQDLSTQEAPEHAKRQARIDALRKEAQRTRQFVAANPPRLNRKGQELKTNLTDPDSAKMATSKGVIQGYAAQAAADSARQIIVAADIVGPGSEQSMLLPMIEQTAAYCETHTLVTADVGYHNDANVAHLIGVNLMTLPPGAWSSQRHWHSHEDEFVFVIEGELILVDDQGRALLRAGECAAFPKGTGNGHHLINESSGTAVYLEVGSRHPDDLTTCSDVDMKSANSDGRFVRKDGTPYV